MLARLRDDESGAVLVVVTLVMVTLLLLAGMVVDLGGVRTFRANNQLVSDAAASAGALEAAATGNGQDVCQAAKDYVIVNTPGITSLGGIDCSAFPTSCTPATGEVVATGAEGGFTVSVAYPVADGSPFMNPELLGAPPQPASSDDGEPCERVSVAIQSDWQATFSRIAGFGSFPANVHSVAKSNLPSGEAIPINLLVLDRFGCQSLHSSGNGGIIVDAIYNPDLDEDPSNGLQPGLTQGIAAADSDASSGCAGGDGVIDIDGSDALIRADGPDGCTNQTGTHVISGFTAGEGCGKVQTLAPGTPGCNFPACTTGGGSPPNPEPTSLPGRLTRAPVDYRYNCRIGYDTLDATLEWATSPLTVANEQDIGDCPDAAADPGQPYLNTLIGAVGAAGTPAGFQSWTGAGYPCTIEGPPATVVVVPSGNWHVDCNPLVNKRTLVFSGGNIVFDHGVRVESTAILAINATSATPTIPTSYTAASPEAWTFFRSGQFYKAGQASLIMLNTSAYVSEQVSAFNLAGGSGTLKWVAPDQGNFDDLALWSDSAVTHGWAGQANLELEGVFFTPLAMADYAGTAGQNQTKAQFIADKLHARGQGTLVVSPAFGRAIQFPIEPQSTLIR